MEGLEQNFKKYECLNMIWYFSLYSSDVHDPIQFNSNCITRSQEKDKF